jgi:hypothetical protein
MSFGEKSLRGNVMWEKVVWGKVVWGTGVVPFVCLTKTRQIRPRLFKSGDRVMYVLRTGL